MLKHLRLNLFNFSKNIVRLHDCSVIIFNAHPSARHSLSSKQENLNMNWWPKPKWVNQLFVTCL